MEVTLFVTYIVLTIVFGMLIKDFNDRQQQGLIVIYKDKYDLFFNAVAYIIPAVVFAFENANFDKILCYVLLCIGFTVIMCISACRSNDSVPNKIIASIMKIIIAIETVFLLALILLVLLIVFGGKDRDRRRTRNTTNYNYNYRRRW